MFSTFSTFSPCRLVFTIPKHTHTHTLTLRPIRYKVLLNKTCIIRQHHHSPTSKHTHRVRFVWFRKTKTHNTKYYTRRTQWKALINILHYIKSTYELNTIVHQKYRMQTGTHTHTHLASYAIVHYTLLCTIYTLI